MHSTVHAAALRRFLAVPALAACLLLSACGSMSYFPPQNLGEAKKGAADLRGRKVFVTLSPQMQIDRAATRSGPLGGGLTADAAGGFYHDRLVAKIAEQLAAHGARPTTEVRDLNDLAAPKLMEVLAKERPDYVLRVAQERMNLINLQPAGIVWLVQLGKAGPTGVDVVFETHYSVSGIHCLGMKVREFAEPTAMECLGKQAEHIVARLDANGYFTGDPGPARTATGLGAKWSEPPARKEAPDPSLPLCTNTTPGLRCR